MQHSPFMEAVLKRGDWTLLHLAVAAGSICRPQGESGQSRFLPTGDLPYGGGQMPCREIQALSHVTAVTRGGGSGPTDMGSPDTSIFSPL